LTHRQAQLPGQNATRYAGWSGIREACRYPGLPALRYPWTTALRYPWTTALRYPWTTADGPTRLAGCLLYTGNSRATHYMQHQTLCYHLRTTPTVASVNPAVQYTPHSRAPTQEF
jgi:hypothetical protein